MVFTGTDSQADDLLVLTDVRDLLAGLYESRVIPERTEASLQLQALSS